MSKRGPIISDNIRMHQPYSISEHARVLKGLLRPFKGKGDFELWCEQLHELAKELRHEMKKRAREGQLYLVDGMPLYLYVQGGRDNKRCYLRWRSADALKQGGQVLIDALQNPSLSQSAKVDLLDKEAERIVINMKLSSLLALTDCAERAYEQFQRLEELRKFLGDSADLILGEQV